MSSSVHIDNKKKYILILGIGATQGLDYITLTAEAQYSINFSRSNGKFCLSLHYNGSNSFLFANAAKIHQFLSIFIGLLIDLVNASNNTKCVSLSNQKCMT